MNLNEVTLAGRLTRDPETRTTPSGLAICKFGLAINERYKAGNEWKEKTLFVDVDAFGKTAEVITKYLGKGDPVYLRGRLKLDEWQDKNSGQKRSKMGVVADRIEFFPKTSQGGSQQASSPHSAAASNAPADDFSDDDVPF